MTIEQYNEYGKFLERNLRLETYPIAIKWFAHKEDVPDDAQYAMRDLGHHMAFCQATAMTRMRGATIAMTKEDQWCWSPLISFGQVDADPGTKSFDMIKQFIGVPPEKQHEFFTNFPRLEKGCCEVLVTSPLFKCKFEPDMILIYSNTMQLNYMVRAIKSVTGTLLKSEFDGIDSCIYATIPPYKTGEYRITIPDPGDVERARAGKDEMILSVPPCRLEELCTALKRTEDFGMDYRNTPWCFPLDFERPAFYNEVFKDWGLDQGEEWGKVKK